MPFVRSTYRSWGARLRSAIAPTLLIAIGAVSVFTALTRHPDIRWLWWIGVAVLTTSLVSNLLGLTWRWRRGTR